MEKVEALKHYRHAIEQAKVAKDDKFVKILTIGAEALEKQVPKEPVQKEDSALGFAWYCPNCGGWVDPSTYKHCSDCGQAIKNDKE